MVTCNHNNSGEPPMEAATIATPQDFSLSKEPAKPTEDNTLITNRIQLLILCIGLVLSTFVAAVDETIVATAMRAITDEFEASNLVAWVASSYLLTTTASTPLYGKFSDIFGRKPSLLFALACFLVGSIFCGFAKDIYTVIAFRGLSGVGAGGLISLSFIIISDSVPIDKRGIYMSLISATFAVSNMFGPVLGGVFVDNLSWRWVFYINFPISIVSGVVTIFFLPLKKSSGSTISKLKRIDVAGTISLVVGIGLFVLAMNWGGEEHPWSSVQVIVCLILGIFIILLFVYIEACYAVEPIIPSRVFSRNVILANLASICMGFCMFVFIYYWPLYFQTVKQSSATKAGTELLPIVLGVCFFSCIGGALINMTKEYYTVKWIGMIFLVTGTALMSRLNFNMTRAEEVIYPLLVGIGVGINIPTNTIACQVSVLPEDTAVVTAIINFTLTFGAILGLAIQGAIFKNVLVHNLTQSLPQFDITTLTRSVNHIHSLPAPYRDLAITAYRNSYCVMFLSLVPFALVGLVSVLFITKIHITSPQSSPTNQPPPTQMDTLPTQN